MNPHSYHENVSNTSSLFDYDEKTRRSISSHSRTYKSHTLYFCLLFLGRFEGKNPSIFYLKNKFFFRLTTVLPADKSNAPPATYPGLGHNTEDWTIELMCVCCMYIFFKVFHSLYFYFFFLASSRWFSLSVDNLFTCIIFVCLIFIRPLAFSLKLVELSTMRDWQMRFGRPSHYTALRLLRSPSTTLSVCRREYSTVSTWNQHRANSNKPSRIIQKPVISIWNRYTRRRQSRQRQKG